MITRPFDLAVSVLVGATVIALPFATQNDFFLNLALLVMIWSIFALGFDLVFGSLGMVSFGHASFLGMGGYILAIFTQRYGWSFEASMVAAVAAAALLAWIVSFFALRVSGIFFALVTLSLSQLLYILADSKLREWTGGADGMAGVTRPQLFGVDFFATQPFYWYVAALFTLVVAGVAMFRASPFGRVMQSIAQNEIRTEQLGYNVHRIKQITFLVSGGISGLAGALLGSLLMFVNPQMLHWTTSGDVIIMTLLGGAGTLWGPVGGVILFEVLKEWLSGQTQYWYGLLGMVFILATIFFPKGFLGEARRLAARVQRRKP
ncbi:branched-chain amino acid ABC transporter permease [Noviherbaspirillum pedocola]|uniref:Branched-chain amino acid ABC transporter permease n=1 Tax=Noviherbaspirillum pedocola TaxID=2801341 RepID=A0A934WAL8_9BURK|nr:branched-chain amino acid ABC transporter permease [Noviherbaspirillum pedocola]MBK4739329.1 branched-chain amino acid ABC transporter permease [Noviherbaspirillum pedocola]